MRVSPPPLAARQLLDELRKPTPYARSRELLASLAATVEASAVPALLAAALAPDEAVSTAARDVLGAVVARLDAARLVYLDERLRSLSPWLGAVPGYVGLRPADLARLADLTVLGLAASHPGGFVRERAVELLALERSGAELRFLLLRVNDWVPQVRDRALAAVRARLRPAEAGAVAGAWLLFERLESCGRASHRELVDEARALLQSAEGAPALLAGLASEDARARRALYALAFAGRSLPAEALVARAAADGDPGVQSLAVRAAVERLPAERLPALFESPRARVRRDSLWAAAERGLPGLDAPLRGALVDPSRAVRDVAQYYLKRSGLDVAGVYRELAAGGSPPALAGLGEVGVPGDAKALRPWLRDPAPRRRRAAFEALVRLEGAGPDDLARALADPAPALSRAARLAFERRARTVAPRVLEELFASPTGHVARNALRAAATLGKWEAVVVLLRAHDLPALRDVAAALLERWLRRYNRSFVAATAGQRAAFHVALAAVEHALDRGALEFLRGLSV